MNASVKSAPVMTTLPYVTKPIVMPARLAPTASPSKVQLAPAPAFTSPPRAVNPLVSVQSFHSTTSQRPAASYVAQSLPSLPAKAVKEEQHWVAVATERLWPHASRYFSKHLVSNFDDEASDAKLDEMAQAKTGHEQVSRV